MHPFAHPVSLPCRTCRVALESCEPWGMDTDVFSVVFVCTGNRCRSPYAAARLRALAYDRPVHVESEGTLDSPGHRSPSELVEVAAGRELLLEEHRARPISAGSLSAFDLVIGFTFDHVAAAVVEGGAARQGTFTLPELARLLVEVEIPKDLPAVERARAMIERAGALRDPGFTREEVSDPFGGPRSAYEEMADEIDGHLKVVAERLFGTEVV